HGFGSVLGFDDLVAAGLKKFPGDFADVLLIFREEDGFRARGYLRGGHGSAGVFLDLIDAGDIDFEASAFTKFAVDPDEAATLLDNAVDRGQAQSGALPFFLGGEEGFEDVRL